MNKRITKKKLKLAIIRNGVGWKPHLADVFTFSKHHGVVFKAPKKQS